SKLSTRSRLLISVIPAFILNPVKTGVPLTWIPFSNRMTDAVRHLDAGESRHDELSLLPLRML
ncbi:MAG: hypothetical protein ACREP3_07410, partial [Candidatus Binatia bacterium]